MKKNIFFSTLLIMFLSFSEKTNSQTASLQVIHNAADPAADSVDVYVNGTLTLNNLKFRTATAFLSVPSGVVLNIGIAPASSATVNDTIANFAVTLDSNVRYVAIANGVLDPLNFASNPDAANIGFNIFIKDSLQANSSNPANVDFIVEHGSTDAPTVDVIARGVATLVDNASYGNITNYISVPAASYILDVTPGNDNSTIVASYLADLSSLAGGTVVVVASGFLDSTVNQNGKAFGLWAFLGDGTAIKLPAISQARLQVIHNAADPGAAVVDVYVNGALLLDTFEFRTATPYIDVPAGVQLQIGVAPGNSTSVADTIVSFAVTLSNGMTYVAIATGVLNPANFSSNPDLVPTGFTLLLQDSMRESSLNPSEVDLRVVHGATDAPTVDVIAQGVGILVDDASYSDITNYINVPAADYTLDITPGNNNAIVVASYSAPLTGLAGGAAVVLASGFLDPLPNQNGPAFALIAVLPDGQVILLNNVTGIEEEKLDKSFRMYPNPSSDKVYLEFEKLKSDQSKVSISDMTGKIVKSNIYFGLENKLTVNTSGLNAGNYILKLENDKQIVTRFLSIQ